MLTFLLSRSDSLQVYTLAMQVRGVERQQHCCFHHHRCHHLQTGHGAWREKGDSRSRGDRGRRDSTIAEVAIDTSEHVRRRCTVPQKKYQFHKLWITCHSEWCQFNYHSGPKLSVWVSAILPWCSTNAKKRENLIKTTQYMHREASSYFSFFSPQT